MTTLKTILSDLLCGATLIGGVASANAVYMPATNDRHVVIVNNSDNPIREFYATTRSTWEDDMLGNGMIRSGGSKRLNIDDRTGRCSFDFRAVFQDGSEIVTRNVDVCGINDFTYN